MPTLSIILVSWNTRQLLCDCLHSIQIEAAAFAPGSIETIVVDNASSDGSADMIGRDFPWITLLANAHNTGFAAANNQALEVCAGEYILCLNPDTLLLPGALEALLAYMTNHATAGAAGSRLLNGDGTLQISCSPAPTLAREVWRLFHLDVLYPFGQYRMQTWPVNAARLVDVVQGAALFVRRTVLDQVGFLDTDYFVYSEEVDLCHRIRAAGWEIAWVPQSRVVHHGGQSTRQIAATMFLQLYQSKVLYFRKRHGEIAALIYKAILLAAAVARIALVPLSGLQDEVRRAHHLTLAGHYLRLARSAHRM